ncbi:MAG: hypothetical protein HY023_01735 [Chloroflexi bacterium]|nr:hypothetical protein [Chloroflexota bacterium]
MKVLLKLGYLRKPSPLRTLLLLLAAHCGLALLMYRMPRVATLHALLALAFGLWAAFHDRPGTILYACAYIAGSEVLWRMTHAAVFWEYGKYAVVLILVIGLYRSGRALAARPLLYLALLLPSAIQTFAALSFDTARQTTSFNLSGPLAIALCAWYCSGISRRKVLPFRVLSAALGPIFGIAALTVYATWKAGPIRFGGDSNFVTSAGFGPNQVASALSFGALLCFMVLAAGRTRAPVRILLAIVGLVCVIQSTMTFSRGGLYMLGGSALCACFYLLRDFRARQVFTTTIPPLAILTCALLFPRLNEYTGGALSHRLSDTALTHRGSFIRQELAAFEEHPLFGVGPGMSRFYRENAAAHTEFTRVLAEHGLFGLFSTVQLLSFCVSGVTRTPSAVGRAFSLALVAWALLFMFTAGLRLVAPALAIGLSAIPFRSSDFRTRPGGRLYRMRYVELPVRRRKSPRIAAAPTESSRISSFLRGKPKRSPLICAAGQTNHA